MPRAGRLGAAFALVGMAFGTALPSTVPAAHAQPGRVSGDASMAPVPPPPDPAILPLIGHYGNGLREVVAYEDDDGRLAFRADGAAIGIDETEPRAYVLRGAPAWVGASARFFPSTGRPLVLDAADRSFLRRAVGPGEGDVFRIRPTRPMDGILRDAARAVPPPSVERTGTLVDVTRAVPGVVLDVRYATDRNFMGVALYDRARAYVVRPAAEALARVQQRLARYGLGLVVYDAYRPWSVTWAFWEATPPAQRGFVAEPRFGSKHNRGAAVDVGLVALQTGEAVEMPSDYDEFTARAASDYAGGTRRSRHYRAILRQAMLAEGFEPNPTEWWHYDLASWRRFPLLNVSFATLDARR